MNREIIQLREVVMKLVPLLTGKGLVVTQRGSQAYVSVDRATRKPKSINIPNISDNATPEFMRAIQGFIDHEVAHVLLTNWDDYLVVGNPNDPKVKRLQVLINIVEDTMIEREIVKIFPGSRKNIADLRRHFIDKITIPACAQARDDKELLSVILVPLMRALAGHEEFQEFMDRFKYWSNPLVSAIVDAISDDTKKLLPKMTSTAQTRKAAEELEAILHPPAPPAPSMPSSDACDEKKDGESEDKPDQKAGEGDGDGERDHSEKDPSDGESDQDDTGDAKSETKGKDKADAGSDDDDDDDDDDEDEAGAGAAGDEEEDEGDASDTSDAKGEEENEDEGDTDSGSEKGEDDSGDKDDAGNSDDGDEAETESDGEGDADDNADEDGETSDSSTGEEDGEQEKPSKGDKAGEDGAGSDTDADGDDADGDGSDDDESDDAGVDEEDDSEGTFTEADDDGNHAAGDPDKGSDDDDGYGAVGTGSAAKSMLDFDDDAFEEADLSAQISISISADAVNSLNASDYTVFTRELDRIEPLKVEGRVPATWIPNLDDETRQMVGRMQKDIERMLASQAYVIRTPGFRSGRLHAPSLHRLTTGDDRVFNRRQEHKSKDTAVSLLIDNSGSMKGTKCRTAMIGGYALSQTLERVQIANEVIGFTTGDWNSLPFTMQQAISEEYRKTNVRFSRTIPLHMPIYKTFDERISATVKERIAFTAFAQRGLQGNVDGESLEYAAIRLMKRTEKRKVMIVLSDGHPTNADNADGHLKMTVEKLTRLGIETIGIGIEDASVARFYPKFVVLSTAAELPGQVMQQLKTLLS